MVLRCVDMEELKQVGMVLIEILRENIDGKLEQIRYGS
jgi:hypothetical protein